MGVLGQGIIERLRGMGTRTEMGGATKNSHPPAHTDPSTADSSSHQGIFPGFGIDKMSKQSASSFAPSVGAQALVPSVLQLTISRAPTQ